jgi:hypothetical protein
MRALLRTLADPGDTAREELRRAGVLVQAANAAAVRYCDAVAAARAADQEEAARLFADGDRELDRGHQVLRHAVDALATALPQHLAHEERDALPLLDQVLTAKEWRGFVTDQRRKTGIRGAAQMFPWLLDSAPAEQVQAVLNTLPPPLRLVYRRIWRPRYERHDHWELPSSAVTGESGPAGT